MKERVFHEGEREAQERTGVFDREARVGSFIRSSMPDQHREFFEQLPFVVVTARDGEDRPWVSLLCNDVGFLSSPSKTEFHIEAKLCAGDALENALHPGAELGLLGLEYGTRRRNRLNVKVRSLKVGAIVCEVVQSFGNCPKYIPQRVLKRFPRQPVPARRSSSLSSLQQAFLLKSETFFIGSGHRGEGLSAGMDASHRGGNAGFVHVQSSTRFTFPDYSGNQFFNTIGNLLKDPRAGFAFVDFENGTLLQMTGRVEIEWDAAKAREYDNAALRGLTVHIEEVVEVEGALSLAWAARGPGTDS